MELKYFKLSEFDSPDEVGSGAKMSRGFLLTLDKIRADYGNVTMRRVCKGRIRGVCGTPRQWVFEVG